MTPTNAERIAALEADNRSLREDLKEIKTLLSTIKRYALWILFGLITPIIQAFGIDPSELLK
jgi:hypothetical protein